MALPALAGGAAFLAKALSSPTAVLLSTAVPAVMALNDSQGSPGSNLGGAAGAALGGLGGGIAGALAGRSFRGRSVPQAVIDWAPAAGTIGGALGGGLLGGSLGRTGVELLGGSWNDPPGKAIRDAERLARSQMALEAERAQVMLPAARAEMQLAAEAEARRAAQAAQLRTIAGYQDALFGAARPPAPPGDPSWAGLLATMGAGALS